MKDYFMQTRSREPELIDLGPAYYTKEEYNNFLYQLGRIGKYLGNNNAMLKCFKNLPYNITSILDVGCGGGTFAMQLAKHLPNVQVTGIDINPMAIEYAKSLNRGSDTKLFNSVRGECFVKQNVSNHESKNIHPSIHPSKLSASPGTQGERFSDNITEYFKIPNLNFELRNTPELNEPPKSFDIVTATLVCHHLSDEEIIGFLKRAKLVARKNIIINDLQRNWVSYFGASILIPIFFPNRLVKNDSLLSIKKSFTYNDWIYYLKQAEFKRENYSITWSWPFRWIIKINVINT